jgi:hypothetical protein
MGQLQTGQAAYDIVGRIGAAYCNSEEMNVILNLLQKGNTLLFEYVISMIQNQLQPHNPVPICIDSDPTRYFTPCLELPSSFQMETSIRISELAEFELVAFRSQTEKIVVTCNKVLSVTYTRFGAFDPVTVPHPFALHIGK